MLFRGRGVDSDTEYGDRDSNRDPIDIHRAHAHRAHYPPELMASDTISAMQEEALVPVFRVRDAEAAIRWYERLGFVVDCEWSSGPMFTETTVVVRRGELALILSSRGNGPSADSLIYLRVADVVDMENEFELSATTVFGERQLELHDPDGNCIRVVAVTIKPRKGRLIAAT